MRRRLPFDALVLVLALAQVGVPVAGELQLSVPPSGARLAPKGQAPDEASSPGSAAQESETTPSAGEDDTVAAALEKKTPADKFALALGGFFAFHDTTVRYDSASLGRGTTLDLENLLKLDETDVILRAAAYWRFKPRHRLAFDWLDLDREADRRLTRDIQIGDDVYVVGAVIDTGFHVELYKLLYSYSVVRKPNIETGLVAGLSTYDLAGKFRSSIGDVSPDNTDDPFVEEEEFVFPVPVFGWFYRQRIRPRVFFHGGFDYLQFSYDDWEASLLEMQALITWIPFAKKHIGFGVGYDYIRMRYEEDDDDLLDATYEVQGYVGYMTFHW